MPTYVYKFTETGETIEVQQAFSDDALTEYPHPTDGRVRPVKKVFLPVGITFKGGGFYKTDSRGGSSSSTSTADSSSSSDSSASTSTATPASSTDGSSTGTATTPSTSTSTGSTSTAS